MRINNNLMAMNTHRQLSINNSQGAKSIEKLSSGYRINRAGDDAAGLAISEKMRSQVRGLGQASRNALDDISLIQTSEGALNETHAIIHRMREIAVQSSNDSNTNDDREALQNEMDQLAAEVTRIANDTEFNTRKLLNGNLDSSVQNATGDLTFHIGANTNQNMKFAVKAMDAYTLGLARSGGKIISGRPDISSISAPTDEAARGKGLQDGAIVKVSTVQNTAPVAAKVGSKTFTKAVDTTQHITSGLDAKLSLQIDGVTATVDFSAFAPGAGGTYTITDVINYINLNNSTGRDIVTEDSGKLKFVSTKPGVANDVGDTVTLSGPKKTELEKLLATDTAGLALTGAVAATDYQPGTYDITVTTTINGTTYTEQATAVRGDRGAISFTDADQFRGLVIQTDGLFEDLSGTIQINLSNAASFTANGSTIRARAGLGIDVTTQKAANVAIDKIDKALKRVSDQRAELGAVQNRLNHTIKNVDTAAENLQASESRIRDVDMAKEMMEFTKNNILQQAAQAMLAQANQAPQGVLQLLR